MTDTETEVAAGAVDPDDDLAQVSAEHVEALRSLLRQPSRYAQRVVERLSFLKRGGERWQRDVQIRLPMMPEEPGDGRFVVSLGMFRRCRFPVRGVMWGYLALNALFGASVAFTVFGRDQFDDIVSGAMACLSVGVIGLVYLSGSAYEHVTRWAYGRAMPEQAPDGGDGEIERSRDAYLNAARRYADASTIAIALVVGTMVPAMLLADWGEGRRDRARQQPAADSSAPASDRGKSPRRAAPKLPR